MAEQMAERVARALFVEANRMNPGRVKWEDDSMAEARRHYLRQARAAIEAMINAALKS